MSFGKSLRIVLTTALGGAAIGGLVGFLVAIVLPNYYASVFSGPVDPVQTGLRLGVSQGLIGGGLIGLGLAAVLTWREIRVLEIESRRRGDYPRPSG